MKTCLPAQPNIGQSWEEHATAATLSYGPQKAFRLTGWKRQLWLWSCLVFFSVVSYCLCNRFIFTSVIVQGKSMLPTLQEGEHYLLDRWTYLHKAPERGDMVVIRDPGHTDYAVKRIVALPGETVFLKNGKVYVNNALLPEPYLAAGEKTFLPDGTEKMVVLGPDQYYVLGDNRMVSEDSRYYGPISRQRITGNLAVK